MHGRWRMQQHGKPCRWRARANRKSARTGPGRQGGGEARSTGDAGQCRSREGASGAEGRGKDERLREWLCLLPRLEGRDFGTRHMRKRRGRTQTVRRCRGVDRPGGTPETTREAGRLACSGLGHRTNRLLPPTTRSGGPCARCMIPLESPVREIRTPGSESGGEETWLGERLRHRHMAKAAGKLLLPRPTAGRASPRLYVRRGKAHSPCGCESRSTPVAPVDSDRSGSWRQRHGLKHCGQKGRRWAVQRPCRPEREVNAEQASKIPMRVATLPMAGEAWHRSGSERQTHRPDPPG